MCCSIFPAVSYFHSYCWWFIRYMDDKQQLHQYLEAWVCTHSSRNCFRLEQLPFANDVQEYHADYSSSVAVYSSSMPWIEQPFSSQFCISFRYCFLASIGTNVILFLLFLEQTFFLYWGLEWSVEMNRL